VCFRFVESPAKVPLVDDQQVEELRDWAKGLGEDERPEVRAAAKAILLLANDLLAAAGAPARGEWLVWRLRPPVGTLGARLLALTHPGSKEERCRFVC
jgi:hypothetical protein